VVVEMAETLHVLCLSPDATTAAGVAAMLASCPDITTATRMADYDEGLKDLREPDLVIVVLEEDPTRGLGVVEAVRRTGRKVHILAVSVDDDPETTIRTVRSGADEQLWLPLSQRDLLKVCIKVTETRRGQAGTKRHGGELWVAYSAKGGVGVTTIVTNLALALRARGRDVALADLDVYTGDAALFLNLAPTHSLRDVVTNLKRLDSTFVQSAMIRHPTGLHVLAAPEQTREAPLELTHEQAIAILDVLTGMHEVTLVDTPGIRCEVTRAALTSADRIFLVTELSLPSLRATVRTLDWLRGEGVDPGETVDVVMNKHTGRAPEIAPSEAARTLGVPFRALLPRDDAVAWAAVNGGLPLSDVPNGTTLQRAIAGLASREGKAGSEPPRRRRGLLGFLSGADSRT
jgi:pilus assembly protein CpaE